MQLTEITIENFRGIRTLHLPLDPLTVLIGENNTGKSTVLEAIQFALKPGYGNRRARKFTEYDFHLQDATATPQTAAPIQITLHFEEKAENEWSDTIIQRMNEVIQLGQNGLSHIWLQCKGTYSDETGSLETMWVFLDTSGTEIALRSPAQLNIMSQLVPLFLLSAIRDASQEFGQRGQFWTGFLKSIQLPDEERQQIEHMLQSINQSVINSNAGLTEVTNKMAEARTLVPLDAEDPVVLEAIPTRIFDMVGKVQVHLKSTGGIKLPLNRHGEGTQGLAVLMLFKAYVAANLAEAYTPESTSILALEEPEAHLHSSAIRSLGAFLETMTGQIIVTSHSGDLVSRVPLTALRRLYKHHGETKIGRVNFNNFDDQERRAIDYVIRHTRGQYLFSRCWLLVEGESEFHLMPQLFKLLGYSQDQINFSVIEFTQVKGKGEPIIKFAKALGIQWFLMADGDQAGSDYLSRANNHLNQGESLTTRTKQLANVDIEHEFWHFGFADFIKSQLTETRRSQIANEAQGDTTTEIKKMIKATINHVGGKPAFAHLLIDEVARRGTNHIPQSIREIITHVVALAGG